MLAPELPPATEMLPMPMPTESETPGAPPTW
jgi:hypothetical protein